MMSEQQIFSIVNRISSRLAMAVAIVLMIVSCSDYLDGRIDSDPEAGYLILSLANTSLPSRADTIEADIDDLNENLIADAIICLFPAAASDDDTPVYMQKVSLNENTLAQVKVKINRDLIYSLFPEATNGSKARVYVVANLDGNIPQNTTIPENPTLSQLKSLTIESDFASTGKVSSFVMDGTSQVTLNLNENDPALSSITGEVLLTRAAAKINLGVKVADTVTDGYGNEWEPVFTGQGMMAMLSNGVLRSAVTPSTYTIQDGDYYNTSTEDKNQHALSLDSNEEEFKYTITSKPYYTYPNSWADENDDMTYLNLSVLWKRTDADEFRTCYYMVPIIRQGSALVRNVSYRVNINIAILGSFTPDQPLLLEDVSYRAVNWEKETIGVSIDDYRYLVLDQTNYELNNEGMISIPFYSSHNSEITGVKLTYYLYNTSSEGLEVPVEITMEQNARSEAQIGDSTMNIYSAWIDNTVDATTSSRTLNFNHPLYQWTPVDSNDNPVVLSGTLNASGSIEYPEGNISDLLKEIDKYLITENHPFSRYEAEIKIVQSDKRGSNDEDLFTRTIKIIQYPGIYITSDRNPGNGDYRIRYYQNGTKYANTVTNNGNTNFGYAFINATWDTGNNTNSPYWQCTTFGSLKPFDPTDDETNPNMYLINISQFSQTESQYDIGDPRLTVVNNLNNADLDALVSGDATVASWDNAAPYMNNDNYQINTTQWLADQRHLTDYYPTNEGDETLNMISPRLRVASEYSAMTWSVDRQNIRKRCATYQERGYPAGRWRLPTKAELEYIVSLTSSGKLPTLFNYDGYYWTAHGIYHLLTGDEAGKIEGPISATEKSTAFVRPVYDDGYWNDSLPQNTNNNLCRGSLYIYTFGDRKR